MSSHDTIFRFDPFAPLGAMNFTLVYDGDLPASGNSSKKTAHVSRMRNVFHDQLVDLWDSHVALRQIATSARVPNIEKNESQYPSGSGPIFGPELPDYKDYIPVGYDESSGYWVNLAAPIRVSESIECLPLIRSSLYLACHIDILFLRHEEPGALVLQGGDLDNRIKTLFDALRMPSDAELERGEDVTDNPLYVLMESDTLISGFSVKTGRLLGQSAKKPHAVRLWIDVQVQVLRIRPENMCLATN